MRLLASLLLLTGTVRAEGWQSVLDSIGLANDPRILVTKGAEPESLLRAALAEGRIVVVEGSSPAARTFGFLPGTQRTAVRSAVDVYQPGAGIVWEHSADVPVFQLPSHARVYTKERWEGTPLAAGMKEGNGAVLWTAVPPGARGYDRFPFLPQALRELGAAPRLEARTLWAFFDSSYRLRVDLDWFAPRWRAAGIAAFHIAAWHFWEPDAERDRWLRAFLDACHRHGIIVYAWIEFPHVSERFWNEHPEWREKTAIGQDAHLDWRKLMNLRNPECARAVRAGLESLAQRFDWDGINLGELYFESLEGAANPSRFTPMNAEVRREFEAKAGFDPQTLFQGAPDPARLRRFLDYRAELAQRLQEEWLQQLTLLKQKQPHLHTVLTHIDDRFDPSMRDKLGADAARLLPAAARHDAAFLVEDPANLWHLGPQRYEEIARRYQPITPKRLDLAIDINVVERYQDVYPTKQQTGVELFQLVRTAARAFPRVALYFESSLHRVDWPFLPAAAAGAAESRELPSGWQVSSPFGAGHLWNGGAEVNGKPWPVRDAERIWLPPGTHIVKPGPETAIRLADLNATLTQASFDNGELRFSYRSAARAPARIEPAEAVAEVKGARLPSQGAYRLLPPGTHEVRVFLPPAVAQSLRPTM